MPTDPTADPIHDPITDLTSEQQHLTESRTQLRRMRDRTACHGRVRWWRLGQPGVPASRTFVLRMQAARRRPDRPAVLRPAGLRRRRSRRERFHIGRRHVSDAGRRPDGRRLAGAGQPAVLPGQHAPTRWGCELRRRFGFQHGDADVLRGRGPDPTGTARSYSAILEQEIERPRVGPMRDIVATIQPEQDVIVRADLSRSRSACRAHPAPARRRSACTGRRTCSTRTASSCARQGVLVVGPNASFLRYIRDVLPALGEIDAQQTTIEELVDRDPAPGSTRSGGPRRPTPPAVATLKGDARLAEVLAPGAVVTRHDAHRGAGRAAWRAALAGRAVRGRGDARRAAGARRAVRRRARRCSPQAAGAPGPGEDGAGRRLPRRPGAGRGRPQHAGEGLRRPAVAGGRPGPAGAAAALRRRRSWPRPPRAC